MSLASLPGGASLTGPTKANRRPGKRTRRPALLAAESVLPPGGGFALPGLANRTTP